MITMHFISWKLINYWLSYAIFQKCLQILWNPLQIFSTELHNSLRYSAGQGLITPCIICTLYLTTKFILQRFHFIIHVVALVVAFVKVLWIMDGIEHYNSLILSFVVYWCVFVNIVVIYVSDNVCV